MKSSFETLCELIEQDCTHTAEAHHIIAEEQRQLSLALQLVPAMIAALTSALVASGVQQADWLWVTAISSAVAACATVLNPNAVAQSHLGAAKNFTILKKEARALRYARIKTLTDDAFALCVEHLQTRYNDVVRSAPPTAKRAFDRASKRIAAGVHDPDTLKQLPTAALDGTVNARSG